MSLPPSIFRDVDEAERKVRRVRLESDLQNLIGPIANLAELSDATLYGMRDRARGNRDPAMAAFKGMVP